MVGWQAIQGDLSMVFEVVWTGCFTCHDNGLPLQSIPTTPLSAQGSKGQRGERSAPVFFFVIPGMDRYGQQAGA